MLDTLEYVCKETDVWCEITTLLIPGLNDSDEELTHMTRWIVDRLGPDVPHHFTAFHPDFKMVDRPSTPSSTLKRARDIAMSNGERFVYTGNVHDPSGQSTFCHNCSALLIERDWYHLGTWSLSDDGRCAVCGTRCPGVFEAEPGHWGSRRRPVRMSAVI